MITNAILIIIFAFLALVSSPLRLLSDVSLSSNITNSLAQVGGYFNPITGFLPITTLLTIFASVLIIEGFVFAYKTLMWVIRRIPTQS